MFAKLLRSIKINLTLVFKISRAITSVSLWGMVRSSAYLLSKVMLYTISVCRLCFFYEIYTFANLFSTVKVTFFSFSSLHMMLTTLFSDKTCGGSLVFFIYDYFTFTLKSSMRYPYLRRWSISLWRALQLVVLWPIWLLWNSYQNS